VVGVVCGASVQALAMLAAVITCQTPKGLGQVTVRPD
jgi:hypothetical protein